MNGPRLSLSPPELAIARSVVYAALFDYPLTLDELHRTLMESDLTPSEILTTYCRSALLPLVVEHRDGFFFPAGRFALVAERRVREARSRVFLDRHRRLLQLVCAVPFTRMVALSGSIAHLNLERDGDLDLFIVTRGAHVWSVTLFVVLIAKLLHRRRVVCANFVLADSHLELEQQDVFTANQVIHLKPLVGGDLLPAFLDANPFVAQFYPNAGTPPAAGFAFEPDRRLERVKAALEIALARPSRTVESACRRAYRWYLRRRSASWRSPEQVRLQADYLKLHTQSHRHAVLNRFDAALRHALDAAQDAAVTVLPAPRRRSRGR